MFAKNVRKSTLIFRPANTVPGLFPRRPYSMMTFRNGQDAHGKPCRLSSVRSGGRSNALGGLAALWYHGAMAKVAEPLAGHALNGIPAEDWIQR
jgi:hypothetical protein